MGARMNADLVVQWAGVIVPLVVLLVQGLLAWLMWSLRREYVSRADCGACHGKLDAQVAEMDTHIASLAGAVEAAPTSKDMQVVLVRLAEISGDLKAASVRAEGQAELLKAMSRQVSMLTDYHVTKNGRDR